MSLYRLVEEQARLRPEAIALQMRGRRALTYAGLLRQLDAVIETLRARGLGPTARIAVVMPEGAELAVAVVSVAAGAICAPLDPSLRAAEADFALADLRADALLIGPDVDSAVVATARARGLAIVEIFPDPSGPAGAFQWAAEPVAAAEPGQGDDMALLLHTSGSAAQPKRVPLSHRNLCDAARNIAAALELTPADRCLVVMPLFHIHGLSTLLATLASGGAAVCTPGFSAETFFEGLDTFGATWYSAAPALHHVIVEEAPRHSAVVARSTLRFVRSASAPMPRQLAADVERTLGVPFLEAYGMTEAAPLIACNRLAPDQRRAGSVGRPAGPEVEILDEAGQPLADGQPGEIAIRGDSVTPGYEGLPPGHGWTASGWLRTGDLGHLDADGFLFVTGRSKDVINRGGEKISPREIDEVLLEHPAVAEAASFAAPHPVLGENVAAAVVRTQVARAEPPERLIQAIRDFAAARLAPFKLPQDLVFVDTLPRSPTGKLRRDELASRLRPTAGPTGDVERRVAATWAEILGRPPSSRHDNFFTLGGHSLSAARVAARLSAELGARLSAEAIFQRPTVAGLAELIAASRGTEASTRSIPRRRGSGPCPLSFAQQRLWFLDRLAPGHSAYAISASLGLTGPLDAGHLERSLDEIRRRHEILRTTFSSVGDEPVQIVAPAAHVALSVVDVSDHADPAARAARLASEELALPFDLERGPLFRVRLVRSAAEEHLLLLTLHHSVSDGWSTRVLHRELAALYAAFNEGRESPLPELPVQYADFAVWQREQLRDGPPAADLAFWREQLATATAPLDLPTDRPRPAMQTHRGRRLATSIAPPLVEELRALSLREDVTLFMTMLAAFQTLLSRHSGQDDVPVGVPIANRTRPETDGAIGFFANTLVLRGDLSGDPPFAELMARVARTARGAFAHQEIPFEQLVEEAQPRRDPSRSPLFQVLLAFQNLPDSDRTFSESAGGLDGPAFRLAPGLVAEPFKAESASAKFDLTMYLAESGAGLVGAWQYNSDLFDAASIERLDRHFANLLRAIVADPSQRLSELSLWDEPERQRLLVEWNRNDAAAAPSECFPRLFAQRARAQPETLAILCGKDRITYATLAARANRLTRHLRSVGVRPGSRVGLRVRRSAELAPAVLGILGAGGAWVPLDPDEPDERLAFLLEDASVRVLVSEEQLRAASGSATVVSLDGDRERIARQSPDPLEPGVTPDDPAYVIYTSGSTGRPKGVVVSHANLSHYVAAMQQALGVSSGDRYLHTASLAFSSSVRQLLVPLFAGAAVVIAKSDEVGDPDRLFERISESGVTILDLVPSFWRACFRAFEPDGARARARRPDSVRLVLSASEPLTPDTVRDWRGFFGPGAAFVNMYGQTETTGIVTLHHVDRTGSAPSGSVPIGRPIARTKVCLIDAAGRPVPIGLRGELCVGGAGVAGGYLDRSEQDSEAFVPDPFDPASGARLFRTGDIARFRSDGELEFLGRRDRQLKIRGRRVAPEEVELVLCRHPGVREAAVVSDRGASAQLVAFVVPAPGHDTAEPSAAELREWLRATLPPYMLPALIVPVASLPRTHSGKPDRPALIARLAAEPPALRAERELSVPHVPPGTPTQTALAEVWQEVLAVPRVGLDDNFFDLGGDSILSVQIVARAGRAGVPLDLAQLFQHQTVRELSGAMATSSDTTAGEPRAPPSGPTPQPPTADFEREAVILVPAAQLRAFGRAILEHAGLAAEGAAIVTEVQLESSLRGQPTHNLGDLPRYAKRLVRGVLNTRPQIRIEHDTPVSARVDGDNGPGQWVATVAMQTAIRKACESGVGLVGVRHSNHFGAAGHYAWLAAREGLIGLCTTNGPLILAPTSGVTPTFGNNPLAVGIPVAERLPILLDIAMSVAPRGRIGVHVAEGKPLPPGWILDHLGRPSTDLADLAAGLGVPIGGHKGYGLALALEVLAGVLTGAGFGADHSRDALRRGAADLGHFFMVVDPALFMPTTEFESRVNSLVGQTKGGERAVGDHEILIPGEAELRAREKNLLEGVPLTLSAHQSLLTYADSVGLATLLEEPTTKS